MKIPKNYFFIWLLIFLFSSCLNKTNKKVNTINLINSTQKEYSLLIDDFFESIVNKSGSETYIYNWQSLIFFCEEKIKQFEKCEPESIEICEESKKYFQNQLAILKDEYNSLINLLNLSHDQIKQEHETEWDSVFLSIKKKDSIAVENLRQAQHNFANKNELKIIKQ